VCRVGDIVSYDGNIWDDVIGIVLEIKGRKWVKVRWADGVIHDEHIKDLKIVSRSR